jgi:ABC-type transport system involved in multi-copper enzyme maturation permease subunit
LLLPGFTAHDNAWEQMRVNQADERNRAGTLIPAEAMDEHRENFTQTIAFQLERGFITQQSADWAIRQYEAVPTPWVFYPTRGFNNFISNTAFISLMVFISVAVCIAPLFANEHRTGVVALQLSSKYGKSKFVTAKLLTAITFSLSVALFFTLAALGTSLAVYGADGASAMLQLYEPLSIYNLTMAQAMVIYFANITARMLFFSAGIVLLSAKLRSSFATLIIAFAWLFMAGMIFIPVPLPWLITIARLLIQITPDMVSLPVRSTFSLLPYEIFGAFIPPFVFEAVFSLVGGVGLLFCAGRVFKGSQVG